MRVDLCLSLAGVLILAYGSVSAQANPLEAPPIPQIQALDRGIRGLLDGRAYSVDTGQAGKPASGKDVVRFSDGVMSTDLCIRYGFEPAPYMVRVEGSQLHFRSEMLSETQGKLIVSGYVEGDRIKATGDWTQARWYWTVNVALWFEGALADPSHPLPAYLN